MKIQPRNLVLISILSLVVLLGCILAPTVGKVAYPPELPETLAAQTLSAMKISAALSATATFTSEPVTDTPIPSNTPTITNTPTPTRTPVPMLTQPPTYTPAPTFTATLIPTLTRWYYPPGGGTGGTGGGGTGSSKPCLVARLIRDITIPEGQWLLPNTDFVKVWRIQNTGSCTWDNSVKFFPVGGSDLDGDTINLPERVRPGKSIDLAVNLETPSGSGSLTDSWLFRAGGETFGNGGKKPFEVSVRWSSSPPDEVYNFASNACDGSWLSNARIGQNSGKVVLGGNTSLSCNGRRGNPLGFVIKDSDPDTEAGVIVLPSLWTVPPRAEGGIIEGSFPAQIILPGYFFKAKVGCHDEADDCDVTFEIGYEVIVPPNNEISENSDTYSQTRDGTLDSIIIDLSGLAGEYVRFEFRVRANNSTDENYSIWIAPQISK